MMVNESCALLHIVKSCSVGSTREEHEDYVDASGRKCVWRWIGGRWDRPQDPYMTMNEEQGMFNRNDEMRTGNVEFIWGSVMARDCVKPYKSHSSE